MEKGRYLEEHRHPANGWEVCEVDDYGRRRYEYYVGGEACGLVTEGTEGATASIRWQDEAGTIEEQCLAYERIRYRVFNAEAIEKVHLADNPYFPTVGHARRAVEQVFPLPG